MNSLLHNPADRKASIAANKLEGAGAALAHKSLYNGKPLFKRPQLLPDFGWSLRDSLCPPSTCTSLILHLLLHLLQHFLHPPQLHETEERRSKTDLLGLGAGDLHWELAS